MKINSGQLPLCLIKIKQMRFGGVIGTAQFEVLVFSEVSDVYFNSCSIVPSLL